MTNFEDIEFLLDKVKHMPGYWIKTNPNCTEIINAFNSRLNTRKKQPKVELEKEIFEAEKKYGDIDEMGGYQILLFDDEFRDILRHFYELGLNARKEE